MRVWLRRSGLILCSLLVLLGVFRVVVVRAPPGWSVCAGDACSARGPWWTRLVSERWGVWVAFRLVRGLGMIDGAEAASYSKAFDDALARLPDVPVAGLLWSNTETVRRILVEPEGDDLLPAVVFLHGFGGLSSAYVSVLQRSLGRVVIVAPALDVFARWDSARGKAVVEETLRRLPPRVDRRRVVLVGLSNGAIFGARYGPAFSGAVLISGLGEPGAPHGPLAVVSGALDARIPPSVVRARVEALRAKGQRVEFQVVAGADHALILTHPEAWAVPLRAMLEPVQ
jgi:dienelactone hydrolase